MRVGRLISGILVALSLSVSASVEAKRVHGATVPDRVEKVGDARFRSKQDWDRTLRFFRKVYRRKPGIVWRRIESPPRVKAVHLANTKAKRTWDGINIYEAGGKVFIYVLASNPGSSSRGKGGKTPK